MLLRLQRHDGSSEEIEVLLSGLAREIASSFDWDAERRRFENSGEEEEAFLPSMAFTDDAFRTLAFGPNSKDDSFWLAYRYTVMRSTFGFHPIPGEEEQQMPTCSLSDALALLDIFYQRAHQKLILALPLPPPFSEIDLENA